MKYTLFLLLMLCGLACEPSAEQVALEKWQLPADDLRAYRYAPYKVEDATTHAIRHYDEKWAQDFLKAQGR